MSIKVNGIEVMMSTQDLDALMTCADELLEDKTILEYGSGGSTSMFADKLGATRKLLSIEHNPDWFKKVGERLALHPAADRITRVLAPLSFHPSLWKFARPEEEMGAGADQYIWAPETACWGPRGTFLDWKTVGLVFVDGIARGPCLAYLRTRLLPGTPVFLHDYKGRENWYLWAAQLYTFVAQHDLTIELRVPNK